MSNKRRNTSSPECDSPAKKQRHQSASPATSYAASYNGQAESDERPQINASTGQTSAFPGLAADDGVFYGPANDGIDYIRMVRSEAQEIPQLLRAQPEEHVFTEEYYEEEQDGRGYWDDDGTYTAKPNIYNDCSTSTLPKAQRQYYESLLTHFTLVAATMRCVPPLPTIEKLTSSLPISFPIESKSARMTWGQCLLNHDPNPVQIACMDESSIFELVRLITIKMRGLFQNNQDEAAERIGAWIWAALGKCPDRGELGSDEISDLRRLAQKAIYVRDWLLKRHGTMETALESEDEDGEEKRTTMTEGDDFSDEIDTAKRRLVQKHEGSSHLEECQQSADNNGYGALPKAQAVKQGKLAVLDMVLTVVGEVYGQRDLLDLRTPWSADNT
ncbi:hypothetical protein LTR70_004127 [Exophiala xenobiotica]|uniref:Uncharacterized protein n=1 Tax=Lithohypha guttulata TaxID=1690604 RepID=A0ABR0KED6_9EURO|nr:hypothetical protein LTR24_003591 [Lithohypha guttulata]KAK5321572.1 hypothetical protein LTR70_004127 [Exophiala xenobiotica]